MNKEEAEKAKGEGKTSFSTTLVAGTSSVWIFLLSIAMMLSAIGDTGYACCHNVLRHPEKSVTMLMYAFFVLLMKVSGYLKCSNIDLSTLT